MGWIQLLDEDWSSFGTDINAVAAAYAHPDGSSGPLSAQGVTVGPTIGPDGGPGLVDNSAGTGPDILAHPLNFTCRGMRVQRRLDLTNWASGNTPVIMEGWWGNPTVPGEFEGSTRLWSLVASRQGSGNHGIIIAAERMTGSDYNSGVQLLMPRTGAFDLMAEVYWSTITGTFGSYAAATDGYIKVFIDGVEVFNTQDLSGLIEIAYGTTDVVDWNGDPIDNKPVPYVNLVAMQPFGSSGRWQAWRSDECDGPSSEPSEIPVGDAKECCGTDADVPSDTTDLGNTPVQDDNVPLPTFIATCVGDGQVPEGGLGIPGDDVWT